MSTTHRYSEFVALHKRLSELVIRLRVPQERLRPPAARPCPPPSHAHRPPPARRTPTVPHTDAHGAVLQLLLRMPVMPATRLFNTLDRQYLGTKQRLLQAHLQYRPQPEPQPEP